MLVRFAVQANMEFEFVFLRFECRDRRILNVFQLSRTIVKEQMNGQFTHAGQTEKVVKSCLSKPDQHVGIVCCPVSTGLKGTL